MALAFCRPTLLTTAAVVSSCESSLPFRTLNTALLRHTLQRRRRAVYSTHFGSSPLAALEVDAHSPPVRICRKLPVAGQAAALHLCVCVSKRRASGCGGHKHSSRAGQTCAPPGRWLQQRAVDDNKAAAAAVAEDDAALRFCLLVFRRRRLSGSSYSRHVI